VRGQCAYDCRQRQISPQSEILEENQNFITALKAIEALQERNANVKGSPMPGRYWSLAEH
jgi:hypothetical protein